MSKKADQESVIAYKGFNPDWTCRGFQFEIGKTFKHEGEVVACEGGFHACEHPLNVFNYYAPASSRYAEVTLAGSMDRASDDTKIAAAEITIKAELKIPDLVARAIDYVFSRATKEEGSSATGTRGAASATGDQGAASATGTRGAASATGDQGAASATGTRGAASATGDQGAASATGDQGAASATGTRGAASATGTRGAAMSSGYAGRVRGAEGNALFLVERETWNGPIVAVWAGVAGKDGVKVDTWYTLQNGKLVEC